MISRTLRWPVTVLRRRLSAGRCAAEAERGSLTLMTAVLVLGLLAVAGLVVDGTGQLRAGQQATGIAQQAARAGADALSPATLRRSGPSELVVNPAAARAAAQQVLAAGGVSGQVSVAGDTVTVTAEVSHPTAILSAVGVDTVSGHAAATATVLYGGTTQDTGSGG